MANQNVLTLTDANFEEEVLNSDVPVLVDFTATWCGPCKFVAPIVDALADEYEGRVKVGKVDIDANRGVTAKYFVRSIPTVMLFKGGKVENSIVGAAKKPKYQSMVDGAL